MSNKKDNLVKDGKEMLAKDLELSGLAKEVAKATDKLAKAIAWKVKMTTNVVELADGSTRVYIEVKSGMPRDCRVALMRGKDNNVSVRVISKDVKHESKEDGGITEHQQAYNDNIDKWSKTVGREATARIRTILESVGGFDDLWAYVLILERNQAIKESEVFFS